ncbi:hypothetical protein Tco_0670714 [Tanacetum coccineum]
MSMTIQSDVKDKILATLSETSKVENAPAEMLRELDQQMEKRADDGCTLWIKLYSKYEYEIRYHPGRENVVLDALRRKERVKPRRVGAMAMTIQYGVRGMILAAQSEAFKQETYSQKGLQMGSINIGNERRDESLFRWMIYLVVLADAAESDSDAFRFEYCLASSSGWTNVGKGKAQSGRDRQKSYADNRRKPLEFEVGDRVMLKVLPWKGDIRFGKKGMLAPRRECNPACAIEENQGLDKTFSFVKEPIENSDREVKRFFDEVSIDDGRVSLKTLDKSRDGDIAKGVDTVKPDLSMYQNLVSTFLFLVFEEVLRLLLVGITALQKLTQWRFDWFACTLPLVLVLQQEIWLEVKALLFVQMICETLMFYNMDLDMLSIITSANG